MDVWLLRKVCVVVVVGGWVTQQNRVTPSPFDFRLWTLDIGLWTWTWIVTIFNQFFTNIPKCGDSYQKSNCHENNKESLEKNKILLFHDHESMKLGELNTTDFEIKMFGSLFNDTIRNIKSMNTFSDINMCYMYIVC